jgi:hypothetical protein
MMDAVSRIGLYLLLAVVIAVWWVGAVECVAWLVRAT